MQDRQGAGAAPSSASPEPSSRRLLTAHQVQDRLGVDASTIYRMAADGRLRAVKVGRQWRFPAEGVELLLSGSPLASSGPSSTPGPPVSEGRGRPTALAAAQAVIDVAADLLGVMMVVTDMAGRPVSDVANPCPWFAQRAEDEGTVAACVQEWRAMADDVDFVPRFELGALGFECARALIRSGSQLVGMVLAGGVAPAGTETPGLYHLDEDQRRAVLATLPKVSAALTAAGHSRPSD